MKTTVRFEGGRELEKALGELGTLYRRKKAARDALMEGAEPVHSSAEAKAPVRSGEKTFGIGGSLVPSEGGRRRVRVGGESGRRRQGALKSHVSIGTRLNRSQRRANRDKMPVEVYVGTRDRAGRLQEFGTREAAAQPWLRPAWDATKMRALEIIKSALWRQISRQAALQARAIKRGRK